jgi:hypothetical protein
LHETFLFLGMRRKIGLDVLGALARPRGPPRSRPIMAVARKRCKPQSGAE